MIIDGHVHMGSRHLPRAEIAALLGGTGLDGAVVFADPESDDIPGDNAFLKGAASLPGRHGMAERPLPSGRGPAIDPDQALGFGLARGW